jgi:hypothetical protein
MPANKRPRKAYRPGKRAIAQVTPREAFAFMADARGILGQCRKDDVLSVDGIPHFVSTQGNLEPMHGYLLAFAKMWLRVIKAKAVLINLQPIINLAKKLGDDEGIELSDLDAAAASIDRLEAFAKTLDCAWLHSHVKTEQIQIELQHLQQAA